MRYVNSIEEATAFIHDVVKQLQDKHKAELEALHKKYEGVSNALKPPMDLEEYKSCWQGHIFPGYQEDIRKAFKYGPDAEYERLDKQLEIVKTKADEIKARNDVAIEHNKKIRQFIISMMANFGIEQSKKVVDKKSRAYIPKKVTVSSGYIDDISVIYCYDSGYDTVIKRIASYRDQYVKARDESKKTLAAVELEKKKDEEKKKAEVALVKLKIKYGLDDLAENYEIGHTILEKNKYLKLAHYLLKNRGDWNDGYDYAETGLDGFDVETEEDGKIYKCISEIINEADYIDGRAFRDCEWSYDVLFQMVEKLDKDLLDDYNVWLAYGDKDGY